MFRGGSFGREHFRTSSLTTRNFLVGSATMDEKRFLYGVQFRTIRPRARKRRVGDEVSAFLDGLGRHDGR